MYGNYVHLRSNFVCTHTIMKKNYFSFLFLFFTLFTFGQEVAPSNGQFDLLGANSESISKQINIRNDLSTGKFSLDVDLFSKQLQGQTVRIGLSYDGGGMRALDQLNYLGSGWTLDFGGAVLRHRRGVPDDFDSKATSHSFYRKFNGLLYSDPLKNIQDGSHQVSLVDPSVYYIQDLADSHHDIFEFYMLGESGRFYIGKDKKIYQIGNSNFKIIPRYGDLSGSRIYSTIIAFEIVNSKGVRFVFEDLSTTEGLSPDDHRYNEASFGHNKDYISSWYLSNVTFPQSNQTITYHYEERKGVIPINKYFNSSFIEVSDVRWESHDVNLPNFSYDKRKDLRPVAIQFGDSTRIKFEYRSSEEDLVSTISLVDAKNTLITGYVLNYQWWQSDQEMWYYSVFKESVFNNYNMRFLESIDEINVSGDRRPVRAFSYNTSKEINEKIALDKYGIDYWGFYNGEDNKKNLIPYELKKYSIYPEIPPTILPAAKRGANETFAKIGSLTDIYLPSGGRVSLDYELHDRIENGSLLKVGGLRIKKVNTYDLNNRLLGYREYKYKKDNGQSSGFLGEIGVNKFVKNTYQDGTWPNNPIVKKTEINYTSRAVNELSSVNGSHIAYSRVEEWNYNLGNFEGKTVFEFSALDSVKVGFWEQQDYYPYKLMDRPLWAIGLPVKEQIFDKDNQLVKKIERFYNIKQERLITENLRSLFVGIEGEVDVQNGGSGTLRYIYKHRNYYPINGFSQLKEERVTEFLGGKPLLAMTKYDYETRYNLLRMVTTSGGEEQNRLQKYYAFDFSTGAGAYIASMITANMLDIPILEEQWKKLKGGSFQLIGAVQNTYRKEGTYIRADKSYTSELNKAISWGTTVFNPAVALSPAYKFGLRMHMSKYASNGDPIEVKNGLGVPKAILYNSYSSPIFTVDNSEVERIRYVGFEPFEQKAASVTMAGQIKSDPATMGQYNFTGTITFPNLPLGNYIVKCYGKGNTGIKVNDIAKVPGAAWTELSWQVSNVTTVTLVSNGNTVDEIRIYPVGAVSQVSATDIRQNIVSEINASGNGNTHRYDIFSRLIERVDFKQNIFESIEHNDKPVFKNVAKSQLYTNNGCPVGYVPSGQVTYTIPAGTYTSLISQSAADEKARLAAQFNGRAYANSYNNCVKGYFNKRLVQYFVKNNCNGGQMGETVEYSVAEGKYVSTVSQQDADTKAQNEVNQNGQAQANQNGRCMRKYNLVISNESGDLLEYFVIGPEGEQFKSGGSGDWSFDIYQYQTYTFVVRPKDGGVAKQFEFAYKGGSGQLMSSFQINETISSDVHISIRSVE